MSVNTVHKYVMELEDRQLIRTEPTSIITKDGRKRNGMLCYYIRPIQEAVDHYNEQQLQQLDAAVERQRVQARLSRLCAPQELLSTTQDGHGHTSGNVKQRVELVWPLCDTSGFGNMPNSRMNRWGEKGAGERLGVASAPSRPQPPAVRAVQGQRKGVPAPCKMGKVGLQPSQSPGLQGK